MKSDAGRTTSVWMSQEPLMRLGSLNIVCVSGISRAEATSGAGPGTPYGGGPPPDP